MMAYFNADKSEECLNYRLYDVTNTVTVNYSFIYSFKFMVSNSASLGRMISPISRRKTNARGKFIGSVQIKTSFEL